MNGRSKDSEERYRGLFENSKDAVTINTPEGKFIDFNQSFLDLLGYSRSELRGMNVLEVYADPADRDEFRKEIERNGFVKDFEVKIRRKDGALRDCLVTSTARHDKKGHIIGYQGILRDITERRRMEEEIRSLAAYPLQNPNPVLRLTREGIILHANPASKALLQSWGCEIGDQAPKYWRDLAAEVLQSQSLRNVDVELGEKVYLFTANPVNDASCVNLYGRDITERKRTEDELRRSEERFRKIFQSNPIPALITAIEGPILDVNEAWVRMTGCSRREAIGHSTIELGMVPDTKQRDQIVKDLLEKKRLSNIEITRRTRSGELRDILNTLELVDLEGQKCILNMQVDITERKKMEDELKKYSEHLEELVEDRTGQLKESEEKFRRIYNASLDAIYTTSIDGEILDMNPAGVVMFGFDSLDELKKVNIASLYVNLDDRKRSIELAGKGPVRDFRVQFRRKDGTVIDCIINSYPLSDERGSIVRFQGAIIDVSEHQQFEKKLEESEERFRGIAERSFDMIAMLDLEGRVTYASPAVKWVTGYTPEEMRGQHFQDYLPKDVVPKEIQAFAEIAKGGVAKAVPLRIVRKDGSLTHVEVNASPVISDGKITGVQAIVRDVSARANTSPA